MKNHGLNWELEQQHRKPEDWIFGAGSLSCIAEIPNGERDLYLPKGEIQKGAEDTMDCASRAPINILETKLNYLLKSGKLPKTHSDFLIDNGYVSTHGVELSDAFVAINSETTRQGNSLINPLEAIRQFGVIPKKLLPLLPTMTWDEYHNPERITADFLALGNKFRNLFRINYERVLEPDFVKLLEKDMLDVGGFAWPFPKNGEYPRTNNSPNHAFVIYKSPAFYAFDNYPDSFDGDFVKKLATDYDLIDYGYRLILSLSQPKKNWLQKLLDFLKGRIKN